MASVATPAARRHLERLERIWAARPGLVGWLTTVDHKRIGLLYFFTSLLFFAAGGVEALLIRTQLLRPNSHVLSPQAYDQAMTMHGVTMIFLFVIPMSIGAFGNYLLPLMIGARDLAFPRLNALSYWVFLASGIFIYVSLALGTAPNAGWFDYVPLASKTYSAGPEHRLLHARAHLHRARDHGDRDQLHRRPSSSCARPACPSTGCPCSASRCWRCRSR